MSGLKVRLEDIPPEGLRLEFEEGPELLADCFPAQGPVAARVFLKKSGIDVKARGHVKAEVRLACDRCLEEFVWQVDEDFEVEFRPQASAPLREETQLTREDLEVIFFEGDEVPVGELVREQVILSVPDKRLCREDCRGLCPVCGKNLNTGECGCPRRAQSPFAVLRELMARKAQTG
ncbi:DUF177 domain-containing protein [Thermosulfurimonas marina]|uniref:DUF177 domain-containing protein n=1 Tax=Thermosulfurimonas marina TaxID=2047767 RepID=A0A6H1WQM1_9BACT|nr:DUF177 domain-containing protein [Thermosulfurimonas marina]QJA05491.1 DUF177 domain-containing protein [Thermosulfurimonas marina]